MRLSVILFFLVALVAFSSYAYADEAVATEAPIVSDVFTPEERSQMAATEQKYEFQAEVNRLMDILINSLYTNRDIFIREIVSNAADALDKIRFIGLTDKAALGEGDAAELDIRIKFDKEKRTLTFTDKGVGMSKDELIKNLGVVARSGTTEFVEAATSGKSDTLSLIGQFGVGFYSVYLVADKVTVTSKSNKDDQFVWESTANGSFTIAKDPRGNTLSRGTEITLHLKKDADEFMNENKLIDLVGKYSQFINFPIYVQVKKTVTEDVEVDTPAADAVEGDVEVTEEQPKKTEKVTREVVEDKQVNGVKAIWTRSASDITDEEYNDFYKALTKDHSAPLNKLHFKAEGDLAFKSIVFVPSKAEAGLYDRYYEKSNSLKLYVRRVLISDDFKDFLPRYLNFVRGVVDSDDLPLNVNRETLAQSRVLKVMSKKVHRKVLDMLKKMAADERKAIEDNNDAAEGEKKEVDKLYTKFWNEFGKSVKLGVLDDHANKNQLVKLLRFKTSKSGEDLVSLEDYVERMPEKQKNILFLTGESLDVISKSPFLERAKAKDVEVLLLADPLDEYLVQSLTEFDGTPLQSLSKAGVQFGDEKKNLLKKQEEDFAGLTAWLKDLYGDKVEKVSISQRLAQSPMVLVTGQYGWSANMERIMKSQAFADNKQAAYMMSKKTVEINPYHPLIKQLNIAVANEDGSNTNKDLAILLYDAALLQSGFGMDKPEEFASRVHRIVSKSLNVDEDAVVESEPEDDLPAPEKAADETIELDAKPTTTGEPAGDVYTIPSEDIKVSFGNDKDEL